MMKIVLDEGALKNKAALHEAVREALDLPDWYGANLDALYDVLTDAGETEIEMIPSSKSAKWFQMAAMVAQAAAKDNPRLQVTVRPRV